MNRNVGIMILALFAAAIAFGATNFVQEGDRITLTWSSTSPSSGDPVIKCAAKATGGIVGVALTGAGTAAENVTVATKGVFNLSVCASSTVGNVNVGDYIYAEVAGITTCTADLTNISSGLLFGVALDGITASTTPGVHNTIRVMLRQPGHL